MDVIMATLRTFLAVTAKYELFGRFKRNVPFLVYSL